MTTRRFGRCRSISIFSSGEFAITATEDSTATSLSRVPLHGSPAHKMCSLELEDVVRGIAEGKGPDAKIRDVMSHEVKYCFEDEDVEHVAENMAAPGGAPAGLNRDKRLVGIVSLGDLATHGSLPKGLRTVVLLPSPLYTATHW